MSDRRVLRNKEQRHTLYTIIGSACKESHSVYYTWNRILHYEDKTLGILVREVLRNKEQRQKLCSPFLIVQAKNPTVYTIPGVGSSNIKIRQWV